MKYGNIKGDATQHGFVEWINLDHFHWEVNRSVAKQPELGPFDITKEADSATTELLIATCCNSTPEKCTISFVRTGEDKAFIEYIFYDSLITKIAAVTGQDGRPAETITFEYTAVEVTVAGINKSNERAGKPHWFPRFSLIDQK
jgi:type VI secretion system Hcp family effector